jgi:hypothetical protein
MTYRASGSGRDSYIVGSSRPNKHAAVGIDARRDTLPDNVFGYLKEQAEREQYAAFCAEQQGAKYQAMLGSGSGGKRIVAADAGVAEEGQSFIAMQKAAMRHEKLKLLYKKEKAQYDIELAARGLAVDPHQ